MLFRSVSQSRYNQLLRLQVSKQDYLLRCMKLKLKEEKMLEKLKIGYVFRFVQLGAGQITLGPDSGVTINNRNGLKTALMDTTIRL